MKKLKGIGVYSDIAIGRCSVWKNSFLLYPEYKISKKDIEGEINRLDDAIKKTIDEITTLKKNLEESAGKEYADIFNFHIFLLQDKNLRNETAKIIKDEKLNVESSLKKVILKLGKIFGKEENDFLKDRRRDILDVVERIVSNLRKTPITKVSKEEIIVAHDLSPTQIVSLDRKFVKGFVTDIGSETSHIAIIARALEIPSVIGVGNATEEIQNGDNLIVDGEEGIVIVNPVGSVISKYKRKKENLKKRKRKIYFLKKLPSKTKDGRNIKFLANIEFPEEIVTAEKNGYDGIGLYRTEYLYINRKNLPTEEEQFLAYKSIAEKVGEKPIIIRTIDIGGDKLTPNISGEKEELNPFLGWRGIRFCLDRKDIFKTQIKAMLRASVYGNIKIMFPMIATIEEVREGKRIVDEVKKELKKEKKEFKDVDLGVMIEIPSAVFISDKLAKEVDFFSIGSNDLIQFTLAVDRLNEKITNLYQPCHPSVLKMIKMTINNAKKNGISVGICGEMASIPEIACLLVGMGIDELSMAPFFIPIIKEVIINSKYEELKKLSEEVFKFDTNKEIINFLKKKLKGGVNE